MNEQTTLVKQEPEFELATTSGSLMLAGGSAFAHIQRVAKLFSASDLIPEQFRGNTANCTIALEMAHRMGANPMAVMQNLYIVHGRPGWSSQFIIACLNQCGKFSPLRFEITGKGDDAVCVAWAKELETGDRLEGPAASIAMARAEGWYGKNGSKWKTMPDLMLRYRAATFFGRLYAPDLLMGMQTAEEIKDDDEPRRARAREAAPILTLTPEPQEPARPAEDDPLSLHDQLLAAMQADGIEEPALMAGLNLNHITDAGSIGAMSAAECADTLRKWATVVAEVRK